MNETVAALYNVTDFYSGECCWFIPIQLPQCEPSPVWFPVTMPDTHTHILTWPQSLLCDYINDTLPLNSPILTVLVNVVHSCPNEMSKDRELPCSGRLFLFPSSLRCCSYMQCVKKTFLSLFHWIGSSHAHCLSLPATLEKNTVYIWLDLCPSWEYDPSPSSLV